MKKYIAFALFVFSLCGGHAQMEHSVFAGLNEPALQKKPSPQLDNSIFFIGRKSIPITDYQAISLNGWQWVEIRSFDNKIFKIEGRYVLSNDMMEIRFEDYHVTLYPSKIKHVKLADKQFVPSLFQYKDEKRYSYFEVLSFGEISLVKKYNLDYEKQSLEEQIYYKKHQAAALPVVTSRRKLLKLFGNSSKLMKNYIAENRINIRDEKDLTKLFDFYNSNSGWASSMNE